MLLSLLLLWSTSALASDSGTVKYLVGSASDGAQALKIGDTVRLGDTINTGPKSLVRIVLSEGVAFQVGPESSMRLQHNEGQPTTIELLKGYVLSRVKKLTTPAQKDRFRVHTRSASLGVRGTTFFAKLEKDGRTFLCVCDGTVKAVWNKGERTITAKHHDDPVWIVPGAKMTPVAPMGWEHTDADIAALAKLLP